MLFFDYSFYYFAVLLVAWVLCRYYKVYKKIKYLNLIFILLLLSGIYLRLEQAIIVSSHNRSKQTDLDLYEKEQEKLKGQDTLSGDAKTF